MNLTGSQEDDKNKSGNIKKVRPRSKLIELADENLKNIDGGGGSKDPDGTESPYKSQAPN